MYDEIERMCNDLANELLAPLSCVETIDALSLGLHGLMEAAARLRVTLSMLVHQLNDLKTKRVLLYLRPAPSGQWLITDRLGLPHAWSGSVTVDRKADPILHKSPPNRVNVINLELCSRTAVATVEAEISRNSTGAVVLFNRSALAESRATTRR